MSTAPSRSRRRGRRQTTAWCRVRAFCQRHDADAHAAQPKAFDAVRGRQIPRALRDGGDQQRAASATVRHIGPAVS